MALLRDNGCRLEADNKVRRVAFPCNARETPAPKMLSCVSASLRHLFHFMVMVALVATIHVFFGGSEIEGGGKVVDGRPSPTMTMFYGRTTVEFTVAPPTRP